MVPIVSMLVIGLVLVAFFYYRHKGRSELQVTIQQAIEKGNELTPELIDRLAGPKAGPELDFRRGIVWIAVGLGFVLFGILIGDEDAVRALAAVGMFPLLIGAAYMIMWKTGRRGA
jgi:hypothetical protein